MFINYFDLIEVDYFKQLSSRLTEENVNEYKKVLEEEVGQVNADEVNLAVIQSSNDVFEMWKGNFRFDDFIVTIKKMKSFQTSKKEFIFNYHNFLHEFKIMQKLNHPNIIKLFGVCSINPYYLIIEHMRLGSLDTVLKQMSSLVFENNEFLLFDLVCIACDISNGLRYLEYQNIVHADLRAKNIFIDTNSDKNSSKRYVAKVFSFEKSIHLGNKESIDMPCTSYVRQRQNLRWSAPETVLPNKRKSLVYSIKSDVYSFGMVLYELITLGLLPFEGKI
jgi:serine/threonine protein kinase